MELAISKTEFEELMLESKRIDDQIHWDRPDNKEFVFDFRAPIKQQTIPGAKLFLKASTNVAIGAHTFAIIYNGVARIKALDVGTRRHKNRCVNHTPGWVGPKHKHTWNDCCKDQWVYVPDDITDGAPFEQLFYEFLKECNITYSGTLPAVPSRQMELMIDELFND